MKRKNNSLNQTLRKNNSLNQKKNSLNQILIRLLKRKNNRLLKRKNNRLLKRKNNGLNQTLEWPRTTDSAEVVYSSRRKRRRK